MKEEKKLEKLKTFQEKIVINCLVKCLVRRAAAEVAVRGSVLNWLHAYASPSRIPSILKMRLISLVIWLHVNVFLKVMYSFWVYRSGIRTWIGFTLTSP